MKGIQLPGVVDEFDFKTLLRTLEGHTHSVNAVAVTNDGSRAISASYVWDLETGEVIGTFSGDGVLYACAVSPDGNTIVAGEASGRVHFLRPEGMM
jgi:WD40 repeat protein